ncbi:Branched-chain amino acid aminotransferase [Fulvivirga imtechensis AK7]|uniref:branched-chain-amino-acid transaminase n=1 Tax=Fulvivirga imtechensis AK7 TaxID=1237149 RepID=L8JNZ4_9BACT|nr:branched-chain amino acid aminotransferase [Fulvivirga imtechensis]ELR69102.1 Branched-chain amino acid aminotransferase [Fulvivirga imtechensis AK7]
MIATLNMDITKVAQSKIDKVDFQNIQFGMTYSDHLFAADYEDGEWRNFKIDPYDDIKISPASPALHYGISIFEGLKAYKHEDGNVYVFRPDKNLERFNKSAERMCMPLLPENIYFDGLNTLLDLDREWVPNVPGTSLYIRPFMYSNDDYIGIRPSRNFKFMIITCPVGAYYAKPVKVKIEEHFVRAVEGGSGFCKTGCNYGPAIYPAKLAQEKGYDQLIWTDGKAHKYIEESGTMNVMFVIGNKLITPALGDTILPGITRDSVLILAREWGYDVEERKVEVAEVISAAKDGTLKEAFGAGTAATIAHIELIGFNGDDHKLPNVEEREFSNKVLKAMDDIKLGRVQDKHNWLHKI